MLFSKWWLIGCCLLATVFYVVSTKLHYHSFWGVLAHIAVATAITAAFVPLMKAYKKQAQAISQSTPDNLRFVNKWGRLVLLAALVWLTVSLFAEGQIGTAVLCSILLFFCCIPVFISRRREKEERSKQQGGVNDG